MKTTTTITGWQQLINSIFLVGGISGLAFGIITANTPLFLTGAYLIYLLAHRLV